VEVKTEGADWRNGIKIHPWKFIIILGIVVSAAWLVHRLGVGIGDQLISASLRLSLQMCCLGYILYPVFLLDSPWVVFGYIFGFMLLIAGWESSARPKLQYPGMFQNSLMSMGAGLISAVIILTFLVSPSPWYNARYLIPLGGMCIQNSLTGVAPALNMLVELLHSRKEHVEVLLSFGGTPYEAAWPSFTLTVRQALIPCLNMMNVAGLVTIPGLMAGQIISGANPQNAALYQIIILVIGSCGTIVAVSTICLLTIRSNFDERGRLKTKFIQKQQGSNVVQSVGFLLNPLAWINYATKSSKSKGDLKAEATISDLKPKAPLKFEVKTPYSGKRGKAVIDLNVSGLIAESNPLTVSMPLHAGEIACIMGPSGIGKSTILKMINDLQTASEGSSMKLHGKEARDMKAQEWRREVMYVHQAKAPLPGTPEDLLEDINAMKVNKRRQLPQPVPIMEKLGIPGEFLSRPWSELSGGEAQRVMCAIALSLNPSCILFDEPTSALDNDAKKLFEQVLRDAECCAIMVTHDELQAKRSGDSVYKINNCVDNA